METYELDQLRGTKVLDPQGDKIGRVEEIYLDNETREPEWLLVNTGLFGASSSFVPLQGASTDDDGLRVPFPKDQVKDAPRIEAERELTRSEEDELYRYYGLQVSTTGVDLDGDGSEDSSETPDSAMTRSEEQLRVGTTAEDVGKVRLRKYVVTENVQQTIPVERVRLETDTVTDHETVDAEVRKEHIEVEGDDLDGRIR